MISAKNLLKRFTVSTLCLFAVFGFLLPQSYARPANKAVPKYASMVMDASTGHILSQTNADITVYPASLTKMMTLLMLFDALQSGRMTMATPMKVSKRAAAASPSKLGLKAGQTIKARDAMMGLITKSANDAAVVIAEHLGGSEEAFARKMTARAKELGMTRSHFMNASGLFHASQVTTARDMLRLSAILIGHYPSYYKFFKTSNFNFRGVNYHNHNRLMQTYRGMDGLKTGFIRQSGFNLAASAKRDGERLIAVVFGGKSAASRNAQMAKLLDAGFAKLSGKTAPKNETIAFENTPDPAPTLSKKSGQKKLDLRADKIVNSKAGTVIPAIPATQTDIAVQDLENLAIDPTDLERAPGTVPRNPSQFGSAVIQAAKKQNGYQRIRVDHDASGNGAVMAQSREMVYEEASGQKTASLQPQPSQPFLTENIENQISEIQAQQQEQIKTQPAQNSQKNWAIQIGAYTSRQATDQALAEAQKRLPTDLSHASPLVAPVQNANQSWIFRARLSNLSHLEAAKACRLFKDCMMIGSGS